MDVLKTFPDESIDCVVTSPPYFGLRDYGMDGQIGLEKTPEEFVQRLVDIFKEVNRVLKKEGTVWLNLTKSAKYYFDNEAIKEPAIYGENGIDSRPAGVVRNRNFGYDSKQNNYPEAYLAKDKRAGKGRIAYQGKRSENKESRGQESFVSIKETRNKRSVWTINTKPFAEAHFATFPEALIEPMVLAGCPKNGVILDCFGGAMTTCVVAKKLMRNYVAIELNPAYIEIGKRRIDGTPTPLF